MTLCVVRPRSLDIPRQPSDQPQVSGGVEVHLEVEAVAQRRLPQHEDALDDDDPRRVDDAHLAAAVEQDVVVDGDRHRCTGGERRQVIIEEGPVEGVRVVEIEGGSLLQGQRRQVDVVRVELEQGEVLLARQLGQSLGDGGLARTTSRRRRRSGTAGARGGPRSADASHRSPAVAEAQGSFSVHPVCGEGATTIRRRRAPEGPRTVTEQGEHTHDRRT